MRLIDADALADALFDKRKNYPQWVADTIGNMPDAVVRCRDCIYGDGFDCPAPLPTGYLCQKGHGSHMGDWFCADGRNDNDKERGVSGT